MIHSILTAIGSRLSALFANPLRIIAACAGIVWAYIEPTVPFLSVCLLAILVDCLTAWRLNRRLYKRFRDEIKKNPKAKVDGKMKSQHMAKMIEDMLVVFLCVILAYHADNILLSQLGDLHLAQYVSAVFCLVQFVSILENESCCNGSTWAKILQRIVADKSERHLGIKVKDLLNEE